jgi:hypothetical protein
MLLKDVTQSTLPNPTAGGGKGQKELLEIKPPDYER